MTQQEQFAYCAGLLDGEGCFHASRNDHCNTFRYGITINMNHDKPLLRVAGLFGGEVIQRKDGGFTWSIPKKLLSRCLDSIMPYLMVKKQQAQLLREMRETFQGVAYGQEPPVEIVNLRQELANRITSLKEDYSLKSIPVLPRKAIFAYVAGLLDAEGSFGIYHGVGRRYVATVQIGMCDPTGVKVCVDNFGGYYQKNGKGHIHEVHFAVFHRAAAVEISKKTKPYRLLKIEQGDLVVLLQNHIDLWQSKRRGNIPHPQHVISQRERWYQRCRFLNSPCERAETKSSRPIVASDSPNCTEPKGAEPAEMTGRYAAA
jgi:hypothetical protein